MDIEMKIYKKNESLSKDIWNNIFLLIINKKEYLWMRGENQEKTEELIIFLIKKGIQISQVGEIF